MGKNPHSFGFLGFLGLLTFPSFPICLACRSTYRTDIGLFLDVGVFVALLIGTRQIHLLLNLIHLGQNLVPLTACQLD